VTTQWHDGTDLDDQLVAAWFRLKAERQRNGKLADALSWLRRYPAACLRVVTQDVDAASIAVQHRWTLKSLPMPTAEEVAHVEQSAKQAIAAIRDANMARNVVPLRAAAQPAMAEVKRGPVLVTPEDEP
jgi:hypothetical protein